MASLRATVPSTGTISPARTTRRSPGATSSTGSSVIAPSDRRCAIWGARSTTAVRSWRARRLAAASSAVPPVNMRATKAPARYLAEREAPGHREEGDRVHANVAAAQRAGHGDRDRDEDHDHGSRPERVTGAGRAGRVQHRADGDRGRRRRGQQLAGALATQHGTTVVHGAGSNRWFLRCRGRRGPGCRPSRPDVASSCRPPSARGGVTREEQRCPRRSSPTRAAT